MIQIDETVKYASPDLVCFMGNNIRIDHGVFVTASLEIWNYVHLAPYTTIIGGRQGKCIFKDFSWTSVGARLICGSDLPGKLIGPTIPFMYRDVKFGTIEIGNFSGIYTNGIVAPNVKMAQGSILAANSFLTEDTEPWTLYAGNPAKPKKKIDSYLCLKYAEELGYDI